MKTLLIISLFLLSACGREGQEYPPITPPAPVDYSADIAAYSQAPDNRPFQLGCHVYAPTACP